MADDIRLVIGVDDRDLIKTQKEQKKFERNLLTIEAAFRKNDITAGRYTAELNKQAKQLSRLGGTYKKANSEIRAYSSTVRKLTDDQLRLTMAQNQAGKSTNRFGMYAQQVGYQVGDFFVQVQSGTSALVAFGQQGTQLAGLLPGVLGAVVGIGLSVGTMLLRSFMDASGASKTFKESLEDTESAMEAYAEYAEKAAENTTTLAESFGQFSNAMKVVLGDLQALEKQEALKNFNQQIENLSITTQSWRGFFVEALNGTSEGVKTLAKELGLTLEEFVALNEESQKTKSGAIEDRVAAAIALRDSILEATGGTENMTKKMRAYYSNLLLTVKAGSELTATLDGSGEEAVKINEAEKERLKLQGENFRARRKEIQALRASQISSYDSQKASIKLSKTQLVLETNYKDALYTENQLQRHKIILQIQNKTITREQGEELLKLTDELTAQKIKLDEINKKESARLALIKLQADVEERRGRTLDKAVGGNVDFFDPRNESSKSGVITRDRANPQGKNKDTGVGSKKKTPQEELAELLSAKQQELDLEKKLVGVFDEERTIQSELFNIKNKYAGVITPQQEKELENLLRLTEAEKERQAVIEEAQADRLALENSITQAMETGFMAMIDGTMSVKDAFKSMAAAIIRELLQVMVVQKAVAGLQMIFGGGGGLFGGASWSANGDVVGKTGIQAYADGGVVSGATMFQHGGGLGVMGEAGPEAIMPLKRGANGKLGVQMEGSGGGDTYVTNNYSISANTSEDTKRLVTQTIQQATPIITANTKASILNDRRRGGQMKSVFG